MFHNYEEEFEKEEFISKVNLIVKKIYNAITMLEFKNVSHFMSEELARKFSREIELLKDEGKKLVYDEVSVQSQITNAYQDSDYYYIEVRCECQYIKYYVSLADGKMIDGDTNNRVMVPAKLLFRKKKGTSMEEVTRCSGCGTTINIYHDGKCPNCGRIYDLHQYDYIIVKMD